MAVLVALAVASFHRVVVGGLVPILDDLLRYFYPVAHLATGPRDAPLVWWNPYVFSGAPLAANPQTFTFYPPRLLFYVLPLDRAMAYLLVSHVAAAGVFMYAFLRRQPVPVGPLPALFGSLVFMLSSYVISHFFHVTMTLAVAWTPLVLLGANAALRAGAAPAVWAGLASGMQILAGHIQTWFFTLLLCGVYAVGLLAIGPRRHDARAWGRAIARLALLLATALAAASVQLLPMVDVVDRMERPRDPYAFATQYSLPASGLVRLIAPEYFGAPQFNDYWGEWNYWELAGYIGIAPLVVAAVGAVGSPRRDRYVMAGVLGLGLALAIGGASPAYRAAYAIVPFLGVFRAPARFLLWFTVAAATLGAFGLEALAGGAARPPRHAPWIVAGLLGVLGVLWWNTLAMPRALAAFDPRGALVHLPGRTPQETVAHLVARAQGSVMRSAAWAGVVAASASLCAVPRIGRSAAAAVMLAAAAADLFAVGGRFTIGIPANEVSRPPAIAAELGRRRDGRLYLTRSYLRRMSQTYLSSSGFGRAPDHFAGVTSGLLPNVNMLYGIRSIVGYDPLRNRAYTPLLDIIEAQMAEGGRSRLLDFLGGRYIVADRPLRASGLRPLAAMRHGVLYENTRAMPEFTVVPAYRVVPRDASIYRTLASPTFDFRACVLLYEDPFSRGHAPAGPVSASVLASVDGPDRAAVDVFVARPALLVANDVFYPGWRAAVDGRPVPLLEADAAFRAVVVPAGRHHVSFTYAPRWLAPGAVLSALAFLGGLALYLGSRRPPLPPEPATLPQSSRRALVNI